jgi:beta-glucosidase
MAVAKHWIFNEQETNRDSESSVVDEKTAWELYYPPFQSAVEAGVSAVMCSYNRIDGVHSCENAEQLGTLREKLGFRGFVQSDWWATHSTSLAQGLDQDMPGIGDYGPGMGFPNESIWFSSDRLKRQQSEDVDRAARRILAAIYRLRLADPCTPPSCGSWYQRNVSSPAHTALARSVAAESVVMLRNEGLLPLATASTRSIAVIGAAAVAQPFDPHGEGQGGQNWWQGDYYSGGGSGHVPAKPDRVVTTLDGIAQRASREGMMVLKSLDNDIDNAIDVAQTADVAIIVAGTTSGESRDRVNLALDDGADELISAVARKAQRVIVLLQVPGAVLMPWRDSVGAILMMFLGGQETGGAWADVLFGDHAPSGRLPVMIPNTEADTVKPGKGHSVIYAEGLATSYRSKTFQWAYPFGHGLTYTTFDYLGPTVTEAGPFDDGTRHVCVSLPVRNSGGLAAKAVVQLYLELPPAAGHLGPMLKGFAKTAVIFPGGFEIVTFQLTPRDLSYYDVSLGDWVMADEAVAHIGESAADVRQFVSLVGLRRPLFRKSGARRHAACPAGNTFHGVQASSPGQTNSKWWFGVFLLVTVPAILAGVAMSRRSRIPAVFSQWCFAPLPRNDDMHEANGRKLHGVRIRQDQRLTEW